MNIRILIASVLVAGLMASACSKKEEPAPVAASPAGQAEMPASHPPLDGSQLPEGMPPPPAAPRQVMVPEDVKATWKAVVLELSNRTAGTTEDLTVNIGDTVQVGDLTIEVQNFLPAFSMGGGMITSGSNMTDNPAVQLLVTAGEEQIFSGWLFSLYPDAHPFQHESYGMLLKDFVKAE